MDRKVNSPGGDRLLSVPQSLFTLQSSLTVLLSEHSGGKLNLVLAVLRHLPAHVPVGMDDFYLITIITINCAKWKI